MAKPAPAPDAPAPKADVRALLLTLFALALLCVLAYGPSLSIPLIEDDFPNLYVTQTYGAPAGLATLLHDAVFRLRATSFWAMYALWQAFHVTSWGYHVFSLLLHIANVWLVFGIARAWPHMRPAAFWAAAFFAVAEGHQEAVMWMSAMNEALLFLFGGASLLCWLLAWRTASRWFLLPASAVLFAFALLSKESAVVFMPLFLLTAPIAARADWGRALARLAPHLFLSALALASIAESRASSFRFSDGSFSLHAPFWSTLPINVARVLGLWGGLACVAILLFRSAELRKSAGFALAWIVIALAPYSFLTYSRQIPSRQTYLASFGLSLIAGLALAHLHARKPAGRKAAAAVALVALAANVGYLWTRKRAQFLARAEPTEQLIRLVRATDGPIWVRCFPRTPYIAEEAVDMAAGRPPSMLIWSQADAERQKPAAVFCYQGR
ncbi:MAG: hypothetical protein ABSC23_20330 [Bryobacteraceae bacterium]|jgi:hypothetical protein